MTCSVVSSRLVFHVDRWQQCWDTPSALFCILHPQHSANTTKSISVVVLLVSVLLETNNKLKNSILWLLTVMCACVFNYVHVQTLLVAWAMAARFKYCTVALKFKERFPELFFLPSAHFYTSLSLWAWVVWLLFWNWSTETLAEQGEQTAHMPCGF